MYSECIASDWRVYRECVGNLHCSEYWGGFYSDYKVYGELAVTGWRRPRGCLKSQVIFRKGAIKNRALLRKMTDKDKASYGVSPPCIREFGKSAYRQLFS